MADQPVVSIRVRGNVLTGWIQSEVSRSIESVSGTFSIPADFVPGQVPLVQRQDEVQVLVGDTVVITGFVMAAEPFYGPRECGLNVAGRDRTGDLVTSTAIHKGGQWRGVKIDRIVRDLVEPFGIGVTVLADLGDPMPEFKLAFGESRLDAIARACKFRGVLPVPDGRGNLLLTKAGTIKAPGEIRRGKNVIRMRGIGTDERRHSEYIVYGQGSVGDDFESSRQRKARAFDPAVRRFSPLVVPADGNVTQADMQALVDHTARVRRGHAYGFEYEVEGWLVNGKPWPINALVPVFDDVAGLDGAEWLICSTRLSVDRERGASTVLVVRPREAYDAVPLKTKVRHRKADRRKGDDDSWLEPHQ
jgi:prophage tail gpP-like protein